MVAGLGPGLRDEHVDLGDFPVERRRVGQQLVGDVRGRGHERWMQIEPLPAQSSGILIQPWRIA